MGEPQREPRPPAVPRLTDGVIRLRPWSLEDAPGIQAAIQDPEIPRFMGIPADQTLEGTRRWLESLPMAWLSSRGFAFAVVRAAGGSLLGSIALDRSVDDPEVGQIGYWVAAPARGHGIATRAVRLLAVWGFDTLGLRRLEITTHEENMASQHVARAAGFRREGVLRGYREHQGVRVDLVMFARLDTD
jgi:RimJ/RimL family protein N-acetyltransferase